jgi:hypothetical protein
MHPNKRIEYVTWSLNTCILALTEISYLSKADSNEELQIINNHTFSFYRAALQYCFNLEYTKLIHVNENKNRPDRNVASIYLLNDSLKSIRPEFRDLHAENFDILQNISNAEFAKQQLELRDIKFAHSDGSSPLNNPFQIISLSNEEIQTGFEHLKLLKRVFDKCLRSFTNLSYDLQIPHSEDRTRNFIHNASIQRDFYFTNFNQAIREGFNIIGGK